MTKVSQIFSQYSNAVHGTFPLPSFQALNTSPPQELHAELRAKLAAVSERSTEAELEEAARLVLLARQDSRVWRAGLDTSYKTFLANKPSSNVKAVLLSIL